MKGKNRQLVQECLERLTSSHIRRDILNNVYSRLNGLEASYLSEEEYIPEEPDWLIAGRIKWLKRTGSKFELKTSKFFFVNHSESV